MTTMSNVQPGSSMESDVEEILRTAICRYETTTGTKLESLAKANTLDDVQNEIRNREALFKSHRHDGSKTDRFRTLVSKSLKPIEKVSEIVAQASSNPFPPGVAIFTAVRYLISAANSVSADYDKLIEFFEELDFYFRRLKILETHVPAIPELRHTLAEVLMSVLDLCGICVKYIKKKRIVKAFRNLVSGEDDELTSTYSRFHKLVEQERGLITNAILVSNEQSRKESEQREKALLERSERANRFMKSREDLIERDSILSGLSTLSFHEKQKDTFSKHREGTGQWVLSSDEFQQWFKGVESSTLWCYGMPGGGKSVITSIAVNHVSTVTEGLNVAVVYIYCDYKDVRTQSEFELLSNIARQLAEQTSPIPPVVREFRDRNAGKNRSPKGDEWISFINALCSLFQKTYILVDALDECPEKNRDEFLRLIKNLDHSVRLFFTSRPIDLPVELVNILRIEISARKSDIETYLEFEIKSSRRLSKFTAKDPGLKKHIIERLKENAAGMFLLAHFQIALLSGQVNPKQVRDAIDILPANFEDFYDEAMKRIESQGKQDHQNVQRALSFIFCAKRPLTVDELCHALSVDTPDTELDEDAFFDHEILLAISVGLIRIDEKSRIIGLVHHTLQEYLEKHPENLIPNPDAEVGKACLTYLSFDVFGSGPCIDEGTLNQRLEKYKFFEYASRNWGHHVRTQLPEQVKAILAYVADSQKLSSSVQVLHVILCRTKDWFDRFPRRFGPLHAGAYWGLGKILDILLENTGTDINSQDSNGATALLMAAKHDHEEEAQLLLNKGADINAQTRNGETALHWATKKGNKKTMNLLLKKGAEITMDHEGWTAFNWAVVNGNIDFITQLIEREAHLDAGIDGLNRMLFLAAEEGQELIVQKLLDSGADVNAKDDKGSTALDFAVAVGHEPTTRLLLENRANVNSRDNYGNSVLHWGIPWEAVLKVLLESEANVNARNDSGQTALCWAAQDGSVAVAQLLIEKDADVNLQDQDGTTALQRAALRGSEAMVQLLLENGANANIKDADQWTPLHGACVREHAGVVELLLDKVRNGRSILDSLAIRKQNIKQHALLLKLAEAKGQGSTVVTGLRFSAQEGMVGRLQTMLDKGADVNAKDTAGYTALELAAFQRHEEVVQLLLDNGADVNLRGSGGCPPLFYAIQQHNVNIVLLLIENGADVNMRIYGSTLLMLAAETGNMAITQSLIEAGADVRVQDYSGQTALHIAALSGRNDMVRLLLANGADLTSVDDRGTTALHLAKQWCSGY